MLAREPETYTVGTILRLTEGKHEAGSLSGGRTESVQQSRGMRHTRLWKMLDEAIEGVLDKVTLQDLKDWYEEMGNDYVI